MAQTLGKIAPNVPVYNQWEADEKFAGKLDKADVVAPSTSATKGEAADAKVTGDQLAPLQFAQYYPDGSVKSAAEFTAGIKYDAPNTTNRTITVKPFCNTDRTAENDNSNLSGRVVIPPFVDASGNPHISDDGTRFKVVGVSGNDSVGFNTNLTAIVAPNTVTIISDEAFTSCTSLTTVSLPAAENIGCSVFNGCTSLTTVSLPVATTIEIGAFGSCTRLDSVDFGDTPRLSVPSLGEDAFSGVPTSCNLIVPDAQYDAWTSARGWSDLVTAGYKFLKHSEWEYARKYEVDKKADKPTTFTAGNLAALDAQGNPTDSQIPKASVVTIPAYNGRNRGYVTSEGGGELSSWLSVSGSTESTMAHGPWTMPRSGIVYVQLQQMSNTDTSVRIGVNGKPVKIESGSVVVDYDYQVVECRVAAKSDVVFPLFMNSGDELYMGVYNTALSKISLSAIYYPAPPADSSQLLQAMSDKGIDVSGITDYGGVADALGLGDSATPQDAVDAVANT